MKTIYKYPLLIEGKQDVEMPMGATILSLQMQSGIPCVWALVDTDNNGIHNRRFRTFGTGHPIPEELKLVYIDTYQKGGCVFHLFEEI